MSPYIYIYIYIYILSSTDNCFFVLQLFSVARHLQRLKLGWKPAQLYGRLSIRPFGQRAYRVSEGIIRYLVVAYVCLQFIVYRIPGCSIRSKKENMFKENMFKENMFKNVCFMMKHFRILFEYFPFLHFSFPLSSFPSLPKSFLSFSTLHMYKPTFYRRYISP